MNPRSASAVLISRLEYFQKHILVWSLAVSLPVSRHVDGRDCCDTTLFVLIGLHVFIKEYHFSTLSALFLRSSSLWLMATGFVLTTMNWWWILSTPPLSLYLFLFTSRCCLALHTLCVAPSWACTCVGTKTFIIPRIVELNHPFAFAVFFPSCPCC